MSEKTSSVMTGTKPTSPTRQNITVESLKSYLPRGSSTKVTQEIVDMINRAEEETGVDQGLVEEQIVSYTHLLGGSVGFEQLLNAIKFCNLTLVPKMTNAKAYKIVFPEKAAEIEARGQTVDSFASMYNNSKTVVAIMKLLIVPAYVTYAPLHHAAIKKQFDLMNGIGARSNDKVSPTVQQLAAAKLADLTKMPEDNSVELKIGMSDDAKSLQQGLMKQIGEFTKLQMKRFEQGEDISTVQKLGISTDAIIEAQIED